jgi:hypothetical protein
VPATGPHVTLAAFCERILTEQDGVLSLIRVVDRLTQTASGPEPPEQMPPFLVGALTLKLIVAIKADQAKGRFTIKLVVEDPSGSRVPVNEQDVNLSPGGGVNLIIEPTLAIQHEGIYWFDVLLGGPNDQQDELMTRVPLEVQYQRQRGAVPPQPSE